MKRIFGLIWLIVTIVVGAAMLFVAVYPNSLKWLGFNLSTEAICTGSWVFIITALWFIFGNNRVTKVVAEVEKSGPIVVIVTSILIGIILEGGKLVKILQEAGFGLPDLGLMFLGLALIAGGLVWVVKHLPVRSVES